MGNHVTKEMAEASEQITMCFVATLAKGGWNPSHAYGDSIRKAAYDERKLAAGLDIWHGMTKEEKEAHLEKKLVLCECVDFVLEKGKRNAMPYVDEYCGMCEGEGLRKATQKEIRAFQYRLEKIEEQYKRDHSGDDCCVEYVMQSQDVLEEYGCWNKPRAWDGIERNRLRHQEPPNWVKRMFPVKIIKGTRVVDVVEKEVSIPVRKNKCRESWKPVQKMIGVVQSNLFDDLEIARANDDDKVAEEISRKVDVTQRLLGKLGRYGDCRWNEQEVRMLLPEEEFQTVQKLWK